MKRRGLPLHLARVRDVVGTAASYVVAHPGELLRAARNVPRFRVGIPLAALQWLARQFGASGSLSELEIAAVPPGVRVGANLRVMGSKLRASADIYVERVLIDPSQIRFDLRLSQVELRVLDDSETPLGTLIRSGALDLRKPGNLLRYMPKRPTFIVEASDDRIAIDLFRIPGLRGKAVEQVLKVVTPLLTLSAIEADSEHLDFALTPLKGGIQQTLQALRAGVGRADGSSRGRTR